MPDKLQEIIAQIADLDTLPTQADCITLIDSLCSTRAGAWEEFCREHGTYIVVHDTLVSELSDILHTLPDSEILEVAAGNGKLAHWLNKQGFRVRATDSRSYKNIKYPDFVEELSLEESLRLYKPLVVIAAMPDPQFDLPIDVLNFPSVDYFIQLGNAGRSDERSWKAKIDRMPGVTCREMGSALTYPLFDDSSLCSDASSILYTKLRV